LPETTERQSLRPTDFVGGVWHGAFLAIGMALVDPNAVLPAFIIDLTGSPIWVGGLAALLAVAAAMPQLFVARLVEPLRRKRPVLLTAIYLRAACWASLGLLIAAAGPGQPKLVLWGLVALLGLFSAGGALGGVPYTDIIGKVIPERRRGAFFASTQAAGKVFSVGAAVLAGVVLTRTYPTNYATLFLLSALSLCIASLGIWAIREPLAEEPACRKMPWGSYVRSLREPFQALRGLVLVAWVTGFGLMAVPFYVVAAKQAFGAPPEATAWFIGALVAGALIGSLVWAQLVDRFGSRRMLLVCVIVSALTPLVALCAWVVGWPILVFVAGLVGATTAGRGVGFSSALLEIAPAERRPTYAATYALLGLPVAAMPLIGGIIVKWLSFEALFGLTALLLVCAVEVVRQWNAAGARYSPAEQGT
jgi:MFS family permease